jgi:ATP-dependent helicase Lhr and Lhr-like helicase
VLFDDGAVLGLGPEGEKRYGAKHFLELFSVFNTPPLVTIFHGLREVGQVHPLTFRRKKENDGPTLIGLGGHGWRVTHVDWARKRAWVEPAELAGKSRWMGAGPPMHYALAQAIGRVLREGLPERLLSQRARAAITGLREEFSWVRPDATTLVIEPGRDRSRWWSFAGDRYNAAVAERLRATRLKCWADGLGVTIVRGSEAADFGEALLRAVVAAQADVASAEGEATADDSTSAMKFAESVPAALLGRLTQARFSAAAEAAAMRGVSVALRILT